MKKVFKTVNQSKQRKQVYEFIKTKFIIYFFHMTEISFKTAMATTFPDQTLP